MKRQRLVAATALVIVSAIGITLWVVQRPSSETARAGAAADGSAAPSASASSAPASTTTVAPTTTTRPHDPAATFAPRLAKTITGNISPKSVVSTGTGLTFAQNMMYTHTMTVYDADGALVKTIPDSVDLAAFGIGGHPGVSKGAPVEAAVDHARRFMFVTNYAMYGANHGPEGSDECSGPQGLTPSYTYRVNLSTLAIDKVAPVGMVPKYVAVTPDDRYVLVTNWCSYDLSVLDYKTLKEVTRIPIGSYPRGIAVDPTSRTAYVAVMGGTDIARVDLGNFNVSYIRGVGSSPRHLVMSADGRRLYATLNGAGQIAAIDPANGAVVGRVATGRQPRSMARSSDGRALYVVNYGANTLSVVRTSDLGIAETIPVGDHPIGIDYEPTSHRLWVALYSGSIGVYDA